MELISAVSPGVWIFIACSLFTLGYLIINQVILRSLILTGSFAYLAYYFTAADQPLWGAITATSIMMVANAIGLAALLLRNAHWTVPKAHRDVFPLLQPVLPGDFRSIMRHARRYIVDRETVVTRQGEPTDKVFFVIKGQFIADKFGISFPMNDKTFIGEVAYLLDIPSAATTTLPAGVEVLEWERSALQHTSRRNPRFKLALEALMSRDLANKMILAVAPPPGTDLKPKRTGDPQKDGAQHQGT